MKGKLYKTEKENYVLVDPTKGTYDDGYMLGTSRESQYNKLSIKNCQAIECGYDLDELADEYCTHEPKNVKELRDVNLIKLGFRNGFNKAMELNKDKLFTLEDIKKAMDWMMTQYFEFHEQPTIGRRDQYLESIQQPTEIDVEIEMRNSRTGNIVKHDSDLEWDEDGLCDRAIPKLDSEGCLILKKI